MTREEFERLTGFYPTTDHYAAIEAAYVDYSGDKQEFCEAYSSNLNGMAEAIQRKQDMASINNEAEREKHVGDLEAQIERLKAELELMQDWKPYESPHNVKQADYERLAASVPHGAYYMTDEEAIDWIEQETGFDRKRITIIHEIDSEEISEKCNRIRKTGKKIDRRPIYCATDYHYIRFNVRANVTNCYEFWKDTLRPFYD